MDLLHHRRDVISVNGLLVEHRIAVEDELAVEEDEGLEVADGDVVDLVGRAARGEEALHAGIAQLAKGVARGRGHGVRGEREHGAVGVEERRLDLAIGIPGGHGHTSDWCRMTPS